MKAETKVKVFVVVLAVVLLASLELIVPGFYGDMIDLMGTGDVHHIAEVLQSYGAWAWVLCARCNYKYCGLFAVHFLFNRERSNLRFDSGDYYFLAR